MSTSCIHIVCDGSQRPAISIERPVHAARVFRGKSPEEVLRLLPLMFSVCGTAQAIAGSQALRAASGEPHADATTVAHGALARIEIAREHLWRILIDWPRFSRLRTRSQSLGAMQKFVPMSRNALFDGNPFELQPVVRRRRSEMQAILADFDAILERDVLGVPPSEWLAMDSVVDLLDYVETNKGAAPRLFRLLVSSGWQAACGSSPRFLPELMSADIEDVLADGQADRFVEAPDWAGMARETSSLTRQRDHELVAAVVGEFGVGLLARALASVTELAATSRDVGAILDGAIEPGIVAESTAADTGVAQVEAARGLLLHRVALDGKRIEDYRVVAPTEWNFHADGAVAEGLAAMTSTDREVALQQADLFLTLMDPCVRWSLEIH